MLGYKLCQHREILLCRRVARIDNRHPAKERNCLSYIAQFELGNALAVEQENIVRL